MACKIKICCISSPEEARLAIRHGADALGLVGKMRERVVLCLSSKLNYLQKKLRYLKNG